MLYGKINEQVNEYLDIRLKCITFCNTTVCKEKGTKGTWSYIEYKDSKLGTPYKCNHVVNTKRLKFSKLIGKNILLLNFFLIFFTKTWKYYYKSGEQNVILFIFFVEVLGVKEA